MVVILEEGFSDGHVSTILEDSYNAREIRTYASIGLNTVQLRKTGCVATS